MSCKRALLPTWIIIGAVLSAQGRGSHGVKTTARSSTANSSAPPHFILLTCPYALKLWHSKTCLSSAAHVQAVLFCMSLFWQCSLPLCSFGNARTDHAMACNRNLQHFSLSADMYLRCSIRAARPSHAMGQDGTLQRPAVPVPACTQTGQATPGHDISQVCMASTAQANPEAATAGSGGAG